MFATKVADARQAAFLAIAAPAHTVSNAATMTAQPSPDIACMSTHSAPLVVESDRQTQSPKLVIKQLRSCTSGQCSRGGSLRRLMLGSWWTGTPTKGTAVHG